MKASFGKVLSVFTLTTRQKKVSDRIMLGQWMGFQFKPGQNQAPVAQSCIMS